MKRHRGSLSATSIHQGSPARSEEKPAMVGRFLIEETIGRGGMSDVYRAYDPKLGRDVALKVLSPALGRNPEFRERFLRESRSAAQLNHPHVVPIFEADNDGDTLFIAMQLVRGCDLKTHIDRHGPLSLDLVGSVIAQAAEALDHAHQRGLLHRDVKPANLMLEEREGRLHVYLTDFGLTKSLGTDSRITHTGELVGSVHYVSPEHLEGGELGTRTDVYSLGCVLYECITGRPPFERDTDMAVLWAHLNAEVPAPSKIRKHVPNVVDRVIGRAMAKRPEERFATCSALAESLMAAIDGIAHDLPAQNRAPRGPLAQRIKALSGVAIAVLLLSGSIFTLKHDWTPRSTEIAQQLADDEASARVQKNRTAPRRDGQGGSNQDAARQHDGRGSAGDSARGETSQDGPRILAGSSETIDTNAPSDEASLVLARTERIPYDVRATDCGTDGPSAEGCAQMTLGVGERFVEVLIAEQTEFNVGGFIVQDYDSDDYWDGPWVPFCNETSHPVELHKGARVAILFDKQGCNNNSTPTIGTIVLRIFRGAT